MFGMRRPPAFISCLFLYFDVGRRIEGELKRGRVEGVVEDEVENMNEVEDEVKDEDDGEDDGEGERGRRRKDDQNEGEKGRKNENKNGLRAKTRSRTGTRPPPPPPLCFSPDAKSYSISAASDSFAASAVETILIFPIPAASETLRKGDRKLDLPRRTDP